MDDQRSGRWKGWGLDLLKYYGKQGYGSIMYIQKYSLVYQQLHLLGCLTISVTHIFLSTFAFSPPFTSWSFCETFLHHISVLYPASLTFLCPLFKLQTRNSITDSSVHPLVHLTVGLMVRGHGLKSGKMRVLDAFCVCVWGKWNVDGGWTPLPTRPRRYCSTIYKLAIEQLHLSKYMEQDFLLSLWISSGKAQL